MMQSKDPSQPPSRPPTFPPFNGYRRDSAHRSGLPQRREQPQPRGLTGLLARARRPREVRPGTVLFTSIAARIPQGRAAEELQLWEQAFYRLQRFELLSDPSSRRALLLQHVTIKRRGGLLAFEVGHHAMRQELERLLSPNCPCVIVLGAVAEDGGASLLLGDERVRDVIARAEVFVIPEGGRGVRVQLNPSEDLGRNRALTERVALELGIHVDFTAAGP